MLKIKSKEITFVVQGAINNNTENCINSIREHFPESTIILSTWKNSETSKLDYDILVENQDPGGLDSGPEKWFYNVNRMIVSSRNGLRSAKTKYAVKTRSDVGFLNNDFLKIYTDFMTQDISNCTWFKQPILTDSHYITLSCLYYLYDWFHFGLTEDLLNLWDIPLATQKDATFYKNRKCSHSFRNPLAYPVKNLWCRLHNEQFILTQYLKKINEPVLIEHHQEHCSIPKKIKNMIDMSDNIFWASRMELGMKSYKYPTSTNSKSCISLWYEFQKQKNKKVYSKSIVIWILPLLKIALHITIKKYRNQNSYAQSIYNLLQNIRNTIRQK